jgi:hypothetical protein
MFTGGPKAFCTRWVGATVGLDALEKGIISCLFRESNHALWVVQPVAQSLYQLHYPVC